MKKDHWFTGLNDLRQFFQIMSDGTDRGMDGNVMNLPVVDEQVLFSIVDSPKCDGGRSIRLIDLAWCGKKFECFYLFKKFSVLRRWPIFIFSIGLKLFLVS